MREGRGAASVRAWCGCSLVRCIKIARTRRTAGFNHFMVDVASRLQFQESPVLSAPPEHLNLRRSIMNTLGAYRKLVRVCKHWTHIVPGISHRIAAQQHEAAQRPWHTQPAPPRPVHDHTVPNYLQLPMSFAGYASLDLKSILVTFDGPVAIVTINRPHECVAVPLHRRATQPHEAASCAAARSHSGETPSEELCQTSWSRSSTSSTAMTASAWSS